MDLTQEQLEFLMRIDDKSLNSINSFDDENAVHKMVELARSGYISYKTSEIELTQMQIQKYLAKMPQFAIGVQIPSTATLFTLSLKNKGINALEEEKKSRAALNAQFEILSYSKSISQHALDISKNTNSIQDIDKRLNGIADSNKKNSRIATWLSIIAIVISIALSVLT